MGAAPNGPIAGIEMGQLKSLCANGARRSPKNNPDRETARLGWFFVTRQFG